MWEAKITANDTRTLNDVKSTHYPEIGHWVSFIRSAAVCDFDLYGGSILDREEGSADPVLVVSCVDQSIGKGLVASGTVGVVVCIVAITDNYWKTNCQ